MTIVVLLTSAVVLFLVWRGYKTSAERANTTMVIALVAIAVTVVLSIFFGDTEWVNGAAGFTTVVFLGGILFENGKDYKL